jgi:nitrile hydratase accessory protein
LSAPEAAPSLPRDAAGVPVFSEPWQARAFALTLALHDRGAYAWSEWAEALGAEIARDPSEGQNAYYRAWLRALESLLAARGIAAPSEVAALTAAWHAAAEATPHGTPIHLENAAL